jgi:hypothetical protein
MANCKHDLPFLMGTADGIVCRACGRVFKDFAEIQGVDAPAPEKPAEKAAEKAEAAPKKGRKKK